MSIFNGQDWSHFSNQALQKALREVNVIDAQRLTNPALEESLQQIINSHVLMVPTLKADQKRGNRHGVGSGMLHVTIPFTGDAMAFSITPTTSTLGLKADVREDYLVIEVHDDHQTQAEVDAFIKATTGNLANLRRDVEAWKPSLSDAVHTAVNDRLAQIKAARDRDQKLDFPID